MYSVSQDFIDAASAIDRDVLAKIDIEATASGMPTITKTITGADIIEFSTDTPFAIDGVPVLGQALSASAKLKIKNPSIGEAYFVTGIVNVKPYVGFALTYDADGNVLTSEYVPLGTFRVSEYSSIDGFATIDYVAYDAIAYLDVPCDWSSVASIYGTTLSTIVNYICTTYGLTLNPSTVYPTIGGNAITLPTYLSGHTVREWLGWIAGLMGANAIIDKDGYLTFKEYEDYHSSCVIPQNMVHMDGTYKKTQDYSAYSEVRLSLDDGSVYPSYVNPGVNRIELNSAKEIWNHTSNFDYTTYFTNTLAPSIESVITANFYYVGDVKYRCYPQIDPGDIVAVTIRDGVNSFVQFRFMVSHVSIKVSGGLVATMSCFPHNGYTQQFLGASTTALNIVTTSEAFPVGNVAITTSNNPPTSKGTWELIDKEFTPTTATQISVGTGSSNDFVLNSTNTTSMSAWVSRHGHSITLSVNAITFKVAVSGTNLTLGTFNLANLGASEATVSPIIMGWSEGAHAIVGMNINRTSGVMQSQDVVVRGTGTSIAAGSSAVFTVELPCDYQYMTDSLCNKFYWKRTA